MGVSCTCDRVDHAQTLRMFRPENCYGGPDATRRKWVYTSPCQAPHEVQISAHIVIHRVRRAARLQVGETVKSDVLNSLQDAREVNLAFTQVVRIVFQMELADALFPQPADFLGHIETALG